MLYRLKIENFYSIRDLQDIDLRAAGNAPDFTDRLAPVCRGSSQRSPRTIAIFGANASGKSTVLRALSFLSQFIMHSFSAPANSRIMFDRFNDDEAFNQPARLAVEFAGPADLLEIGNPDGVQCRYAYELVVGGMREELAYVQSETLHYWPTPSRKKVRLFRREQDGSVRAAQEFRLAGFKPALEKVLRPNASIISTLVQLKHEYAGALWDAAATIFSNIFIERTETKEELIVQHFATNRARLQGLNRDISRIDLGIQQVNVLSSTEHGPIMQFLHEGLSVPMPIHLESHGTRSFLKIYPIIASALETGGIAIIDELDCSIHPMILPEILSWFHDPIRNPGDAQLWVTCQNVALLDFLSKEEVLFCEKDMFGKTSVYRLSDIDGVRRDDNFYRKYLSGVYGAVPQIG